MALCACAIFPEPRELRGTPQKKAPLADLRGHMGSRLGFCLMVALHVALAPEAKHCATVTITPLINIAFRGVSPLGSQSLTLSRRLS